MAKVELELDNLSLLLRDAEDIVATLEKLQSLPLDIDMGHKRRMDPRKAEVNHALLHLQTLLTTAAGEAGMQYWRLRGRPDCRYDEADQWEPSALIEAVRSVNNDGNSR
jgi:hypothetical protein